MVAAANVLLDASLQQVPRDTNALADSAFISKDGVGVNTVVYAGYGMRQKLGEVLRGSPFKPFTSFRQPNPSRVPANYAWTQHFNMTLKHTNGKARFLSDPARSELSKMRDAFRAAIQGTP